MKKVVSFLLSICIVWGLSLNNVQANNAREKYIQVSVKGQIKFYKCLLEDEEIYCSIENLAEISDYNWTQSKNNKEFEIFREHESKDGNSFIESQTSVAGEVTNDGKMARIKTMSKTYSLKCMVSNDKILLPMEKLLYLLHTEWTVEDNVLYVIPMPPTILDFLAVHEVELSEIASTSEDVLIDTGWLFSDNKWGQALYSTISEVFSDFDGKIFLIWWPEQGHVKTAECYEEAILQLAKKDEEFIGEKVKTDALTSLVDSIFYVDQEYYGKIQNIMSLPENINDTVNSIQDAVSVLESMRNKNKTIKNTTDKIKNNNMDLSFLDIPELKSKVRELEAIGDGIAILQCVWNAMDTANRVHEWDSEYLDLIQVLADYDNPDVNETVSGYIRSSAQLLIDSYNDPGNAALDEAAQSALGLLFSKVFEASPFGKAASIMDAAGSCYGTFDTEKEDAYDMYSELCLVTYSIKIEQAVQKLLEYGNLAHTDKKLTTDVIKQFRNQLLLYLRLNFRNKAQLYELNLKGNKDKNWASSQEAEDLYKEIVKSYAMLVELNEIKEWDYRIILDDDLENIHSFMPEISMDILADTINPKLEKLVQKLRDIGLSGELLSYESNYKNYILYYPEEWEERLSFSETESALSINTRDGLAIAEEEDYNWGFWRHTCYLLAKVFYDFENSSECYNAAVDPYSEIHSEDLFWKKNAGIDAFQNLSISENMNYVLYMEHNESIPDRWNECSGDAEKTLEREKVTREVIRNINLLADGFILKSESTEDIREISDMPGIEKSNINSPEIGLQTSQFPNSTDFVNETREQPLLNYEGDILPDSSCRYLDVSEVSALDTEDVQKAINEIYARHGRVFITPENDAYFRSKNWYQPIAEKTDEQIESEFNEFEKANLDLMEKLR